MAIFICFWGDMYVYFVVVLLISFRIELSIRSFVHFSTEVDFFFLPKLSLLL